MSQNGSVGTTTSGDEDLRYFCRMLRARSAEHQTAMAILEPRALASVMVGLLRQELDSMVRVIYLLTTKNRDQRNSFIKASLAGEKWKLEKQTVTDRMMVDRADVLQSWAKSVYKFGCSFIHLSNFHDYQARDPFLLLPSSERDEIVEHLRQYHGGPYEDSPTFKDLVRYFPRVLEKVSARLEDYIGELESGADMAACWVAGG